MAYASTSLCCISGCIESRRASRLKSVISDVSGTGADLHVLIMGNLETKSWRNVIKVQFADIPHVAVHAVTNSPAKISELLGILYKQRPNVVVAIGGGAVMDAAKAAAALYRRDDQRRSPWTCCDVLAATEQRQDGVGIPVIAVPTTPGTGAEVTPNASIWTAEGKRTLRGQGLLPRARVLDPSLIVGLKFADLVSGLLDAFTHAVEASWSISSTDTGRRYAEQAIRLTGEAAALLRGTADVPIHALKVAQEAGHWAGHAISITPTTSCHAVSYVLTRRRGLRHGHACALALIRLLPFNEAVTASDCTDPRGVDHVHRMITQVCDLLAERTETAPLDLISGDCPDASDLLDGVRSLGLQPVASEGGGRLARTLLAATGWLAHSVPPIVARPRCGWTEA